MGCGGQIKAKAATAHMHNNYIIDIYSQCLQLYNFRIINNNVKYFKTNKVKTEKWQSTVGTRLH